MPILESAGEEAFTLVIGQRSVIDLRHDGSTKRTSLRSILPGGGGARSYAPKEGSQSRRLRKGRVSSVTGTGSTWGTSESSGERAPLEFFEATTTTSPTRDEHRSGGHRRHDAVAIPESYHAANFAGLEASRLFSQDVVAGRPHTSAADRTSGPTQSGSARVGHRIHRRVDVPRRHLGFNARPDPVHYATPVPINATFGITGLMWRTSGATPPTSRRARALLEARYDLKLGIWDLASNPTLRKTLLDASPVLPPPPTPVPVPQAAERRAEARVDAKMHAKEVERSAIAAVHRTPGALKELGWARRHEKQRGVLQLPLPSQCAWTQ